MKIHINFRKVKESEEIKSYAKDKILRELEKFRSKAEQVDVVITKEGQEYVVKCHMTGKSRYSFHVEGRGSETHEAVDQMIKKSHAVMSKKKGKLREHRVIKDKFYQETSFADLYLEEEDHLQEEKEDLRKKRNS